MKVLIDQNISHRIVSKISPFYGIVHHVKDFELHDANDYDIFMYARNQEFDVIITIDEDFIKLLNIFSHPPKIIWIRTGNCSTDFLAQLLIDKTENINGFLVNVDYGIYEIFKE